jgi:hypothetical protein
MPVHIRVWDKPHVVQTHQKSKTVWVADHGRAACHAGSERSHRSEAMSSSGNMAAEVAKAFTGCVTAADKARSSAASALTWSAPLAPQRGSLTNRTSQPPQPRALPPRRALRKRKSFYKRGSWRCRRLGLP